MNDLSVKPAELRDLLAINEIRRAVRADQASPYRLSDLEDHEIVGPERFTFVAVWKQGEAAIGYARVHATSPLKYADRADLEIYVAEHRRGGVVGRALLDRVVQHVHAATSVKTLVAKVHDDAPASRKFFERQGFKFGSSDHPGSTLTLDIRNR